MDVSREICSRLMAVILYICVVRVLLRLYAALACFSVNGTIYTCTTLVGDFTAHAAIVTASRGAGSTVHGQYGAAAIYRLHGLYQEVHAPLSKWA